MLYFRDYSKFTPEAIETNRKLAEERRNKMFAEVEAETSINSYAGYAESSASIIIHKIIFVILWLLSFGLIAYATITYELTNETDTSMVVGVVPVPMLFMFFVFAVFLYSQLKTGNSSNYYIYTRGIRRFRRVAIIYAIITTLTVIAQLIIIFTSKIPPAPQIVILIGIGLSAAWLIVILECTRKISFYYED